MPCIYDVTLKGNDLREDKIILDSWEDKRWETIVKPGRVFAYGHDSMGLLKLRTNAPAFLSTRVAKPGQELGPDDTIAVFAADGEDIPYNKPSCIVDYD